MKMEELFTIKSVVGNRTSLATHGICGLQNMRNTCYLNCILQCIRYNPYLYEYLRENYHTRHLNQDTVPEIHNFISAWRQILCDFWDHNDCVIQPVGFSNLFNNYVLQKKKGAYRGSVKMMLKNLCNSLLIVFMKQLVLKFQKVV